MLSKLGAQASAQCNGKSEAGLRKERDAGGASLPQLATGSAILGENDRLGKTPRVGGIMQNAIRSLQNATSLIDAIYRACKLTSWQFFAMVLLSYRTIEPSQNELNFAPSHERYNGNELSEKITSRHRPHQRWSHPVKKTTFFGR